MDDRFNTATGWVLFAGVVALGLSATSSRVFDVHRPEKMGYPIEVADAGGGEEGGPDLGTLLAAADASRGETAAAARCGACHTFTQGGAMGTGPNLWGTLGKPMGGHAGFANYSKDMKEHGGSWTWELMDKWLLNPKGVLPGTAMGFAGMKNAEARADILLYLNSLGSNLPLPAPKAPDAPAAEGAEGEAGVAAPEGAEAAAAKPAEGGAAEGDAAKAEEKPAAE